MTSLGWVVAERVGLGVKEELVSEWGGNGVFGIYEQKVVWLGLWREGSVCEGVKGVWVVMLSEI